MRRHRESPWTLSLNTRHAPMACSSPGQRSAREAATASDGAGRSQHTCHPIAKPDSLHSSAGTTDKTGPLGEVGGFTASRPRAIFSFSSDRRRWHSDGCSGSDASTYSTCTSISVQVAGGVDWGRPRVFCMTAASRSRWPKLPHVACRRLPFFEFWIKLEAVCCPSCCPSHERHEHREQGKNRVFLLSKTSRGATSPRATCVGALGACASGPRVMQQAPGSSLCLCPHDCANQAWSRAARAKESASEPVPGAVRSFRLQAGKGIPGSER